MKIIRFFKNVHLPKFKIDNTDREGRKKPSKYHFRADSRNKNYLKLLMRPFFSLLNKKSELVWNLRVQKIKKIQYKLKLNFIVS